MDILISLKSRVLSQAFSLVLEGEEKAHQIFLAGESSSASCNPDMIIADAVSVNQTLCSRWPKAKVLLIDTGLRQEDIVTLLLTYKIDGILSTEADAVLLRKALEVVQQGQLWVDNDNMKALLRKAGAIARNGTVEKTSKRERDILDLVVQGYKNKEIATQLFLSEPTVKVHVSRILRKFDVVSRSQLITRVMRNQTYLPE